MPARVFTPENAEGFGPLELIEMNAAYARLSARRERSAGAPPDAAQSERLRALVRGAAAALRGNSWAPTEVDIVAEVERRELPFPPQ
jgi:hypothetical protein